MDRLTLCIDAIRKGHRIAITSAGTKVPVHKAPAERVIDEGEASWWIRRHNANWAILLYRVLVGDKDATSQEANLFVRRMGLFYSPMSVRTKRGVHYYAQLPEGTEARAKIKLRGMPLDLLTGPARFAMGPGSEVDGHEYELRGEIVPPAELPVVREALVNLLIEQPRKEVRASIQAVTTDERASKYVARIEPAVQGQGGSRALFVACLKVLSLVNGDCERAWPLLLAYNARCVPPWDTEAENGPDSLKKKLRDASKVWKPK